MSSPISCATEILNTFERLGWKGNDPTAQMLELHRNHPAALGDLVLQAMERPLKHATFVDAALDLMDDDTYRDTVGIAWQRAMQGARSDMLSEILDTAALQHPHVFASDWNAYLTAVYTQDGGPEYLDALAWRALDARTRAQWNEALDADVNEASLDRDRAIALLRSRDATTARHAWTRLFRDPFNADAIAWRQLAGYAEQGGQWRSLHTERPLHIRFSATQRKQMLAETPAWRRDVQKRHPTWQPPGDLQEAKPALPARMGGQLASTCGHCHAPLHRLLALDAPDKAGIDSQTPLTFATCLSCQGWEADGPMFFRHAQDGLASAHPSQRLENALTPDYVAAALLEADVQLFAASARWAWQDWGQSNGRQNLSRVGGAPSWVQSAEYPACPDCHEDMDFVMQLDSGLPQADGGEWLWGSGGCNYTFWCAGCRVSGHLWQCT